MGGLVGDASEQFLAILFNDIDHKFRTAQHVWIGVDARVDKNRKHSQCCPRACSDGSGVRHRCIRPGTATSCNQNVLIHTSAFKWSKPNNFNESYPMSE